MMSDSTCDHVRSLFRTGPMGILTAAAVCAAFRTAAGVDRRYRLAAAEQWKEKRGFYLNFENKEARGGLCRLETMRLILGVGDGSRWRFPSVSGPWEFGRAYTVKAVIARDHVEILVDGVRKVVDPGGFVPGASVVTGGEIPGWARSPAEYVVCQESLDLRAGDGTSRHVAFPAKWRLPPGVLAFNANSGAVRRVPWPAGAPLPWTIEVRFRILRAPDVSALAPLVDRYGQARYADWPEKVRKDDELREDIAGQERRLRELPLPQDRDRYGGWLRAGWKAEATGFFRVVRRNGVWWLISPEGNPCFYVGMDSLPMSTWPQTPVEGRRRLFEWLPPREPPWRAAWGRNHWGAQDGDYVAFQACNLIRKYGPDGWQDKTLAAAVERIRRFGFMGGGKWGAPPDVVSTPVLSLRGVPRIARHPDVFDPAVRRAIRKSLAAQIEPRKNDPFVLGWSIGNEYNEIIDRDEVRELLKQGAGVPAKRAIVRFALETLYRGDLRALADSWKIEGRDFDAFCAARPAQIPERDLERIRRFYADRYYRTLYETVKSIDPNHLYLGFWIVPDWWGNEQDWRIIARWCDVIGYDRYADDLTTPALDRLIRDTDRPILLGEFSFPTYYGGIGERGFGQYGVFAASEAESGEKYARLLQQAARHPYCVGALWFEYRDQPITGRGPGHGPEPVYGEHYAFGIVTITDRIKWDLALRMRAANLEVCRWRQAASGNHE